MVDVAALFSVIAIYSGAFLPVVMAISFLLGYSTINTVHKLSRTFVSNGGYYSYAGKTLGKFAGIFTGLLYIAYGILVVPNISLFFSVFLSSILGLYFTVPGIAQVLFSLVFSATVVLFVSRGLKLTLKYTVVAGFMEMGAVLLLSVMFFLALSGTPPALTFGGGTFDAIWTGVIFGILAFSGSGSSIFISENVEKPSFTVPRSLLTSYTVSGLIMVLSSLSLVLFLGNPGLQSYMGNPLILPFLIGSRLGVAAFLLFAVFGIVSAFNLCVSYLNALSNSVRRMVSENLFGDRVRLSFRPFFLLGIVFALTVLSAIASYFSAGFFFMFAAIAGAVSLSYISVHIIMNVALFRIRQRFSIFTTIMVFISSAFLVLSFYYSLAGNQYSLILSNIIFAFSLAGALLVTLAIKIRKTHYDSIAIGNVLVSQD